MPERVRESWSLASRTDEPRITTQSSLRPVWRHPSGSPPDLLLDSSDHVQKCARGYDEHAARSRPLTPPGIDHWVWPLRALWLVSSQSSIFESHKEQLGYRSSPARPGLSQRAGKCQFVAEAELYSVIKWVADARRNTTCARSPCRGAIATVNGVGEHGFIDRPPDDLTRVRVCPSC